jgi:hypothetical protein
MKRENVYRALILIMAILLAISFWTEEKQVKETKTELEEAKSFGEQRDEAQSQLEDLLDEEDLKEQQLDSMANLIAYITSGKNFVSTPGEKQVYKRTLGLINDLSKLDKTNDWDAVLEYFHPSFMETLIRVYSDNGIKVVQATHSDLVKFVEENREAGAFKWQIHNSKIIFANVRENVGTIIFEGNVTSENVEEGKINSKAIYIMTFKKYDGKWLIGNLHVSRYEVW